jgi:hypothetical protein
LIEMIRRIRDQTFKSAQEKARGSVRMPAPASALPAR